MADERGKTARMGERETDIGSVSIAYYIVGVMGSFLFSYLFLINHWNENINRNETFDFVAPV